MFCCVSSFCWINLFSCCCRLCWGMVLLSVVVSVEMDRFLLEGGKVFRMSLWWVGDFIVV